MRVERCELAWLRLEPRSDLGVANRVQPRRSWRSFDLRLETIALIHRHERCARSGVLEKIPQQLRRRIRVDHDDNRAAAQNSEQGCDKVDAVRQCHDHAFFRTYVVGDQQLRDLPRAACDVSVRECPFAGANRNSIAPPFRDAEFDIMFDRGISYEGDLVDLAVLANVVEKSGAWYTYGGTRLGQGRENSKQFLFDNKDIAEEIRQKILASKGMIDAKRAMDTPLEEAVGAEA